MGGRGKGRGKSESAEVPTRTIGARGHEPRLPSRPTVLIPHTLVRMDIPWSVHEYCLWDAHNITISTHIRIEKAVEAHLIYNTAPLLIICKDKTIKCMNLTRTIEPDTKYK
jgi:hypothetical protein